MNQKLLEDLEAECPSKDKWCFIREILSSVDFGEREDEHVRLVFDYKFLQSVEEGKDIGEERALNEWITKGYAERFLKIYNPGMRHEELKRKLLRNTLENIDGSDIELSDKSPIESLSTIWKTKGLNQEVLEDLMQDCPCNHTQWCFPRELVKHLSVAERGVEQTRLVYTLKFLMSRKAKNDVGIVAAKNEWIEGGYAKLFREIYKPGMKHEDLKYKMFIENAPAVVRLAE